jgi:hypothetical protein
MSAIGFRDDKNPQLSDEEALRRILDPFDVMRSTRALAPHDPKLNDIRWLIGEALRRVHQRAKLSAREAARASTGAMHFPLTEIALHARDKIRAAEQTVGPDEWPIVVSIVIEGACVRDCRSLVPEVVTPWRADAVVMDRLRVALDQLGGLMGVTAGRAGLSGGKPFAPNEATIVSRADYAALLAILKRAHEELCLIRMKDCAAVYDTTLRAEIGIALSKVAAP